jgi:hypothetical protein
MGGAGTGGAGMGGAGTGGSIGPGGGAGGAGGQGGMPDPCGNGVLDMGEECDDSGDPTNILCVDCKVLCPAGGHKHPTTHHCYVFGVMDKQWGAASADCMQLGMYLTSITSAAEVTFVQGFVTTDTWIGGTKQMGQWVWANGENWPPMPPWGSGQPNDTGTCVEFRAGSDAGTWNDESCNDVQPYICEWTPPGM